MKIIIIVATTLDGKIAKSADHNVDWTSKADKAFFRTETQKAGAVIFGSKTYNAIGRPMPDRLNIVMTMDPQKYEEKVEKDLIEFTDASPEEILEDLTKKGFDSVVIGGGAGIYSLFLEKGLVDEIYLTFVPKIFGQGVNFLKNMNIDDLDLELISFEKLADNGEILAKYKIKK